MNPNAMKFPISIRQFLPHREPMLMVDDVLALGDDFIKTNFHIKTDNIFIENGVFSEVGIIENAAQTCSGIVGWPFFEKNSDQKNYQVFGYISKIKRASIFELPVIGSELITEGTLLSMHQIGNIYNCDLKCETFVNGVKIAESYLNLIIQP